MGDGLSEFQRGVKGQTASQGLHELDIQGGGGGGGGGVAEVGGHEKEQRPAARKGYDHTQSDLSAHGGEGEVLFLARGLGAESPAAGRRHTDGQGAHSKGKDVTTARDRGTDGVGQSRDPREFVDHGLGYGAVGQQNARRYQPSGGVGQGIQVNDEIGSDDGHFFPDDDTAHEQDGEVRADGGEDEKLARHSAGGGGLGFHGNVLSEWFVG